jgi:hypothetical protein
MPIKSELLAEKSERQCFGCVCLRTFKARPDERERYGFGSDGYGCNEPGFEGYVHPYKPICVRGPYLRTPPNTEGQSNVK